MTPLIRSLDECDLPLLVLLDPCCVTFLRRERERERGCERAARARSPSIGRKRARRRARKQKQAIVRLATHTHTRNTHAINNITISAPSTRLSIDRRANPKDSLSCFRQRQREERRGKGGQRERARAMMAHAPPSSPRSLAELPLGAPRPARQCADLCLDLLLAEAVRVYNNSSAGAPSTSTTSGANGGGASAAADAEAARASAPIRPPRVITPAPVALEAAGVRVGRAFAERLCRGASNAAGSAAAAAQRPRPPGDALDAVKFVCKEFWTAAFRKQVDALRTNHRVR